ncbi:hypothetical protein BCR42DRAFT_451816 [Absidia repens]|uniref:Uncharacterized protein n=1 Tax=Absidia repens TaxID=90262 RepID=A0A1X2IG55_9FUNG|nr:hypothetical protein BCR42DRAFT_451816 [Absidia repens]
MDCLTTAAVPAAANRAQRRAIQREQKKVAKKAAKKAIKLGLPVPVSTAIPVQPASITTTTTNTPATTILKEVVIEDSDKNATHPHQGSSLPPSKRSSVSLDQDKLLPVIIPVLEAEAAEAATASAPDMSSMHDDTIHEAIDDSASVITDLPHVISTITTHEEVNDPDEETLETDTDDGGTETLAPLLCPVYVTQPSLPEHRQNEKEENDDDTTSVKEAEEEIISDTTSMTVKPSSFLSSPSYSLDDMKHPRTDHHHAISPNDGSHHHGKNSDHINFLEKQSSAETLVLKTKAKKFHKVILTSLKKKKAAKKEKESKPNKKSPPIIPTTKKPWQFWKKESDKMAMT